MDTVSYILLKKYIEDLLADAGALAGKSAYQYAVEGGYTGTEAEFAAKMAEEIPSIDNTLTNRGQAADAKAVGDRFRELGTALEEVDRLNGILPDVTVEDAGKALVVSSDGKIIADDGIVEQDVLPEQVLTFTTPDLEHPKNPYEVMLDESFYHFQTGGTYYVVWDGTVYPCVAANLDAGPEKIIYIGNLGVAEAGENTGEPFLLGDIYTVVDDSGGTVLSASGGYTNSPDLTLTEVSHTVRIYQRVKAVPYYTKAEIDAALGSYINDIDALIGDISAVTGEA